MTFDTDGRIVLVFATDFHLASVPPGRRVDDYQRAILNKVKFMADTTTRLGGFGICGGDVFHFKKPRAAGNTLNLIESAIREFKRFPHGGLFGCIGNHDLSWDRMDSLPHQPLGIVIASGAYHNIVDDPLIIRSGEVTVQVDSYPYTDSSSELLKWVLASKRCRGVNYRVGLMHAYGHPDPSKSELGKVSIGYDPIGYDALANSDYDFLLWGHDHSRLETVKVGNVTHVRLGSLSRASVDEDHTDRKVSMAVLAFEDGGVRYKEVDIPTSPYESIFSVANVEIDRIEKSDEVSTFFSNMDVAMGTSDSVGSPREVLKHLCPDDPVLLRTACELCDL